MSAQALPQPVEMSEEEFRKVLDERCRRDLDVSLDEFVKRLALGDLPDLPAVTELAILVGSHPGSV